MSLMTYLRQQAALPESLRDQPLPEPTDDEREEKRADLARRLQADIDQTMLTMIWANGETEQVASLSEARNRLAAIYPHANAVEVYRDGGRVVAMVRVWGEKSVRVEVVR